jgi:hypothetical protein
MENVKTWTVEEIKSLLLKSNKMVEKSLVKLYALQTEDEKVIGQTVQSNGVGFNGVDSNILSSFAKQVMQGRTLSDKQIIIARKKIVKYAKQLTKIANSSEKKQSKNIPLSLEETMNKYYDLMDRTTDKPSKNLAEFNRRAKQWNWIIGDTDKLKSEIIDYMTKVGFEKENGVNVWWYYEAKTNKTYSVSFPNSWNDFYNFVSIRMDLSISEGESNFHTRRLGETWFEDGQWKTLTRRGIYVGD